MILPSLPIIRSSWHSRRLNKLKMEHQINQPQPLIQQPQEFVPLKDFVALEKKLEKKVAKVAKKMEDDKRKYEDDKRKYDDILKKLEDRVTASEKKIKSNIAKYSYLIALGIICGFIALLFAIYCGTNFSVSVLPNGSPKWDFVGSTPDCYSKEEVRDLFKNFSLDSRLFAIGLNRQTEDLVQDRVQDSVRKTEDRIMAFIALESHEQKLLVEKVDSKHAPSTQTLCTNLPQMADMIAAQYTPSWWGYDDQRCSYVCTNAMKNVFCNKLV